MAFYGLKWHFMVFYGKILSFLGILVVIDPNSFGLVSYEILLHFARILPCPVTIVNQSLCIFALLTIDHSNRSKSLTLLALFLKIRDATDAKTCFNGYVDI